MHILCTRLETIPAEVPYLGVDPPRVARFERRIAAASGLKVGLVWAGSPSHAKDRNRSLPLTTLAPLLATKGVSFFSLQKDKPAGEISGNGFEGRIVNLGPDLKDFADTAAAVSSVDLVITVDTAMAHLAGALGKRVWTLIPFAPDWRWLLDRDDSPWYPTMRLYRQPALGDWDTVISRVADNLSRHAEQRPAAAARPPSSNETAAFAEALRRHRNGRSEEAEVLFRSILADDPRHHRALYYLGVIAGRRDDYLAAEDLFRRALTLDPHYADAHYNLGNTLAEQGRLADAVASYQQAALLKPNAAEIHVRLASALHEQGRLEEAAASYRCALSIDPRDAAVHLSLGAVLQAHGLHEDAAAAYRRALTLNPDLADAHNNLGVVLAVQKKTEEAIASFEAALRLNPQLASAHANLGLALRRQDRLEEAAQSFHRALALRPDDLAALTALGNVLRDQGKLDESKESLQRAVALHPDSAEAYNCLGLTLARQNNVRETVEAHERAVALNPNHAWAHLNLGMTRLLNGELPVGAEDYEWRWQIDSCPSLPSLPVPAWDGRPIPAQPLLLRTEQGFGDAIQFIRYAPLVRQHCGRLVMQCPPPLARLLATAPGVDEVVANDGELPSIAAHAALLSVMRLLGTTLETIPADVPYLGVDPSRVTRFEERLTAATGLKVGLVWAGNPIHGNDRHRSLQLTALAPLLAIKGARFFSLQKGEAAAESLQTPIEDLGPDLKDFADTAAAVSCLDLVITVDTAVAHLVGALAKPVWTLLPFAPDWRWLLDREDSPWYPTMRLYRQPSAGDWGSVIDRVAADLSRHAEQHAVAVPSRQSASAGAGAVFAEALQHHRAGQPEKAEIIFRRVLADDPAHSRALYYLGIIAGRRGDHEAAEGFFRHALALAPHYAEAHYNLGNILQEQGRLENAVASYRRAVALEPTAAAVHHNLADTLRMLGLSEEAAKSYRRTIAINPAAAEAHLNLGNLLQAQGRPQEAIACFHQVLRLLPDHPAAHYNIGNALRLQDRLDEAVARYRHAISLNRNYADAYNNLGNALHDLGRLDEAIGSFRRALALRPNSPSTHKNLGLSLLLKGDLPQGSGEYEWRWGEDEFKTVPPAASPRWDGQPVPDHAILLRAEQGYGDAIQFVRYAPLVRARCGRVVLQCATALGELLATTAGIDAVVTKMAPIPDVAAHAPLLSLMHIFGTKRETIPADVPYLRVDPARAARFAERIGAAAGLKVGLAWAGNPEHHQDKKRSLPLAALFPLLGTAGTRFFSLQKGEAAAEISAHGLNGRIVDLGPDLGNFADTAAAINCLDLVIAVDTAIAHLAGALAKPIWTLLPFSPDWRWLLDRDDTPWYPTMRLYRQPAAGDWGSVIASVTEALAQASRIQESVASVQPGTKAIARPAAKPTVMFDWPPSSYTGWGVYGLNLMLHWARRSDLSPCCSSPVNPAALAVNALERMVLDPVLKASHDAGRRLREASGGQLRVSCPVLHGLGNNLLSSRDQLMGTPSIGVVFFEFTKFDNTVYERSSRYSLIVAGSTWNRDVLAKLGIGHVQAVLQGVDTSHFHPGPRTGLFVDRFVVFSGGKLERRKGQDLVVQAFRAFAERHRDALLVTAWSSPWPNLARSVEKNPSMKPVPFRSDNQIDVPTWLQANGIPRSQFLDLGQVPNAQMPRILREVDVALFPNRAEGGTNLVAMECMACGVPTILSANTGHLDLIQDSNCFVLERQRPLPDLECQDWGESDPEEIIEILETAYQNRSEAQRRARVGAEALMQLSWARQLDKLAELIRPYLS
jgi:tetratricopeptide (TPR) repeat protein/glycosyltransferase involved in cell wall biosynthesis